MTSSASALHHKPEFDKFLFATIGEEKNGMFLSVVSALARLNCDPWQEAAALTHLPKETAIQRLASLIAKLPVEQLGKLDETSIAARLIGLLPSKREAALAPQKPARKAGESRIAMLVFFAMSLLVAISLATNQRSMSHADHGRSPASGTASTQRILPAH